MLTVSVFVLKKKKKVIKRVIMWQYIFNIKKLYIIIDTSENTRFMEDPIKSNPFLMDFPHKIWKNKE